LDVDRGRQKREAVPAADSDSFPSSVTEARDLLLPPPLPLPVVLVVAGQKLPGSSVGGGCFGFADRSGLHNRDVARPTPAARLGLRHTVTKRDDRAATETVACAIACRTSSLSLAAFGSRFCGVFFGR
jgi:hypothetical protein